MLYDAGKNEKEELLVLIIVADVASPDISGYKPTTEKRIPIIGNLKMIFIYRFTWITNILLAITLFIPFIQQSRIALGIISGLLALFTLATFILMYAKQFIRKAANTNEVGIGKVTKMNVLTPNAIAELFINRASSVSLMVGSIFLN